MRIFLEPNETLLFRTGRPFEAGETDYAETLFPPTPETIQGAVRTLIATAQNTHATLAQLFSPGSSIVSLIGDQKSYGRFRITNIALARRKRYSMDIEALYPAPAHLAKDDNGHFYLRPVERTEISSNMPAGMRYLLPERETAGKIEPAEGWLTEKDLYKVLNAQADLTNVHIIPNTEIFLHEPRLGIGMNNASKSTRDGMLYSVQMLRMQHDYWSEHGFLYGFVVDIRLADATNPKCLLPDEQTRDILNLRTHDQGWVILGGEQRTASYYIIGESPPLPQQESEGSRDHSIGESPARPQQKSEGSHGLLYLATPAVLKNGWQPEHWPTDSAPVAAAISRYQSIGGWKLQPGHIGENKSMHRCVPAGSVYFFHSMDSFPGPLTDYGMEIGYGITLTGVW